MLYVFTVEYHLVLIKGECVVAMMQINQEGNQLNEIR